MYIYNTNSQVKTQDELGTQFTCFTSTKVQILTRQEALQEKIRVRDCCQFACFTGTQVQILTQRGLRGISYATAAAANLLGLPLLYS